MKTGSDLFLTAQWDGSVEFIHLQFSADGQLGSVSSKEFYDDEGDVPVCWTPLVTPEARKNGTQIITLTYRAAEHDFWKEGGFYAGTSTISLSADRTSAKATWKTKSLEKGVNGTVVCYVSSKDPIVKVMREVAVRKDQQRFKKKLLKLDKECVISGEKLSELLEAAHIVEVAAGGSDSHDNGMLLRSDLHRLFDHGYLWIAKNGAVEFNRKKLSKRYIEELTDRFVKPTTFARVRRSLKHRTQKPMP